MNDDKVVDFNKIDKLGLKNINQGLKDYPYKDLKCYD